MKVLVIGGAGVFGSRLARLLVRDGHSVTLGGRNLAKAQELANSLIGFKDVFLVGFFLTIGLGAPQAPSMSVSPCSSSP